VLLDYVKSATACPEATEEISDTGYCLAFFPSSVLLLHSLRAFPSVIHGRKDDFLEKVVLGILLLLDTCFPLLFSPVVLLVYIVCLACVHSQRVWFGSAYLFFCVCVWVESVMYTNHHFFSMLLVSLISNCSEDFERQLVSGSAFLLSEFTRKILPSGIKKNTSHEWEPSNDEDVEKAIMAGRFLV
jgi:hypothetical protein